jgi:hypothetical protein
VTIHRFRSKIAIAPMIAIRFSAARTSCRRWSWNAVAAAIPVDTASSVVLDLFRRTAQKARCQLKLGPNLQDSPPESPPTFRQLDHELVNAVESAQHASQGGFPDHL